MKFGHALWLCVIFFILLPLTGVGLWFFGSIYYSLFSQASNETLSLGVALGCLIGLFIFRKSILDWLST
ncbi:hypothetical protein [Avibacterium paragallinarum]|uniref:hypothetical protein n=1 Tax=Avibacterium paragallinarum TaxID=728 RepID=UPI0010299CBF|nr:hypothetical protein [Avibacterium paragallinarum]RZN51777.1 hypothetical protein EIG78_12755 [Avibacterium paragallinarum]